MSKPNRKQRRLKLCRTRYRDWWMPAWSSATGRELFPAPWGIASMDGFKADAPDRGAMADCMLRHSSAGEGSRAEATRASRFEQLQTKAPGSAGGYLLVVIFTS